MISSLTTALLGPNGYIHMCIHIYTYACVDITVCVYVCMYTYMYVCAYVHIHTQMPNHIHIGPWSFEHSADAPRKGICDVVPLKSEGWLHACCSATGLGAL